jgi:uncharacterized protein YkwD
MVRLGVALGVLVACGNALLCVQCSPPAPPAPPRAPPPPPALAAPPAAPSGDDGGVAAEPGPSAASPSPITAIEAELIGLINRERGGRALAALVPDDRLTAAARGHSREMAELRYFDHRSPTAGLYMPIDRFLRVLDGIGADMPENMLLGENIYHISEFDHYFNAEFGHRAIMNSPSHRAAILEPRYTKVGVGVYQNEGGELWATEMFLRDAPWPGEP